MAKKTVVRWVIGYRQPCSFSGLYVGQWLTRKDAIAAHIEAKGKDWKERRRRGDYATKATITYEEPK